EFRRKVSLADSRQIPGKILQSQLRISWQHAHVDHADCGRMTNDVQSATGESAGEQPLATSSPVPRRRISPWVVVILGGALFCLGFAVLVGVIALVHPGARPVVRGLQERRMSDGTILVLEKVTVGSSHQFEWQRKQSISDWINGNWTQK